MPREGATRSYGSNAGTVCNCKASSAQASTVADHAQTPPQTVADWRVCGSAVTPIFPVGLKHPILDFRQASHVFAATERHAPEAAAAINAAKQPRPDAGTAVWIMYSISPSPTLCRNNVHFWRPSPLWHSMPSSREGHRCAHALLVGPVDPSSPECIWANGTFASGLAQPVDEGFNWYLSKHIQASGASGIPR